MIICVVVVKDSKGRNEKVELMFFFFQAEDGIRDAQESRGLGDVYKRQVLVTWPKSPGRSGSLFLSKYFTNWQEQGGGVVLLSLIHI